MPGERLEDALTAASELGRHGIGAVLTQLGEDVTDLVKADDVTRHYMQVLTTTRAGRAGLPHFRQVEPARSRPRRGRCQANLRALVDTRQGTGDIRVDRHGAAHAVDATLEIYRGRSRSFTTPASVSKAICTGPQAILPR